MKNLFFALSFLFLSACTHSINFKANHFMSPVTADHRWSGHFAAVAASNTRVRLIDDINTNPPTREVAFNRDIAVTDSFGFDFLGIDAGLSVYKALEVYLDNYLVGLRYQFLNHGPAKDVWVASLQAGYGKRSEETTDDITDSGNTPSAEAKSGINTSHAGLSVGYKYQGVIPYISYLYERHDVSTDITNTHGAFNQKDSGVHNYYSLGLRSNIEGIHFGIEYSYIDMKWGSTSGSQNAFGGKFGFSW